MHLRIQELQKKGINRICIDDVRFPEEVEFIKTNPFGYVVKIKRPNNPFLVFSDHISEQQDGLYYDALIQNNSNLSNFTKEIEKMFSHYLKIHGKLY